MDDKLSVATALRTVRCPKCGSTRAGANATRSVVDLTFMECRGCGYSALQDTHERDHHWMIEIELAPDEPIPAYVTPLDPQKWLPVSMAENTEMTEVDVAPPDVFGCEQCFGENPEDAWEASRVRRKLTALMENAQFSVRASGCACGQNFITVFSADQTWDVLPVTDTELKSLTQSTNLIQDLQTCGRGRRFLARRVPNAGKLVTHWESGGYQVRFT